MYTLVDENDINNPIAIENLNENVTVIKAPAGLSYDECIAFIEWCELRQVVPSVEWIIEWRLKHKK